MFERIAKGSRVSTWKVQTDGLCRKIPSNRAKTEEQKCTDSVLTGPAIGFVQMKRNCASEVAAQMGKE